MPEIKSFTMNFGPQHPSAHGVLRLILVQTYLKNLPDQIKKDCSEYGISMDGDGDRVVIVDRNSNILDGDDILYTIVRGKIINHETVPGVVGTTMTNYALEIFYPHFLRL